MPTLLSGQLVSLHDVKLVLGEGVVLETNKTKGKRLLCKHSHFILFRWWQTDCCPESMRESMNSWTDEQNNGTGINKIWPILISNGTIGKTLTTLHLPLLLFSFKIPNTIPYTNASKAIHYHTLQPLQIVRQPTTDSGVAIFEEVVVVVVKPIHYNY